MWLVSDLITGPVQLLKKAWSKMSKGVIWVEFEMVVGLMLMITLRLFLEKMEWICELGSKALHR